MRGWYILRNRKVMPVGSLEEWAAWRASHEADVFVGCWDHRGVLVSTVFLGFDYRLPPILFETMIFGGPEDQYQRRCSTFEEAEVQHDEAMRLVRDRSTV